MEMLENLLKELLERMNNYKVSLVVYITIDNLNKRLVRCKQ